jgi:thioredoxin 1
MIEVSNKYDLESQIRNSKSVLALFYASWCPFCRSFLPLFAKNASKSNFCTVLYVKIDDYDNPLWEEYSIEAVPTVILFEEGEVCRRLDGRLGYGISEREFKRWIEQEAC